MPRLRRSKFFVVRRLILRSDVPDWFSLSFKAWFYARHTEQDGVKCEARCSWPG